MSPNEEYRVRRERWGTERKRSERLFIQIGNVRLCIAILEAFFAYLFFGPHLIPGWLLVVPVLAFVALAAWHARVIRQRTYCERALKFYDRGLGRLDDKWIGTGSQGDRYRDSPHLYEEDLDIFGKGSLFELISNARTAAGENMLARWLLAPATQIEASARQQAVKELCDRLDLREDLALLGADIQAHLEVEYLQNWGMIPPVHFPAPLRWVAMSLGLISVGLLIGVFAQAVSLWLFVVVLAIDLLLGFSVRKKVDSVLHAAEALGQGLDLLSLTLARLEHESFESPRLQHLKEQLTVERKPASIQVRHLSRWIDWLDSGDHLLIKAIRPLLLWREQIAIGIESWRAHSGQHLSEWLGAVAELEALSSFAALSFERPDWCFPELLEEPYPHYKADDLKHPLLPPSLAVGNNLELGSKTRLLILSGSNMSGKSTLLRAIGLSSVLAWAGAPVSAASLRISHLEPGASIRVTDSLLDNRSRFFAEITRIRAIVEIAKRSHSVLFLLDELLSGTNSHDRRIGASAIIHKLIESGSVGVVTTHDLALAEIQNELPAVAANVHLEDRLVDGRITFDYKLRPGVVTHSNALELMRAVGLEV